MADIGQKRSFKTISHKHLLTININKSAFFGFKMGQTKHKSLRARDFLRFSLRKCGRHLEQINFEYRYKEYNTSFKSNTQILKFLKVINTK